MRLTGITLYRFALPLKVPYKLAFGPVETFDTILAVAEDLDGNRGVGEATILTGYTPETIREAWAKARKLAPLMAGLNSEDAKAVALSHHEQAPFTVTALTTAVEMLEGSPYLTSPEPAHVPLLAIINATDEPGIAGEIEARIAEGFETLKIKVGFDWQADATRLKFIQGLVAGLAGQDIKLRIDGNQGYTREDALAFARQLRPDAIELFEQPCHMHDWSAAEDVAGISPVPMMLDESIYGPAEIERAAERNAAAFIKLKLMKAGSLTRLAAQLDLIRDLGMEPVLGNGVASDPGCWMEACVARRHITNAGEMNGYLKPKEHLFDAPLETLGGGMMLPVRPPRLRPDQELMALAADTAVFGAA